MVYNIYRCYRGHLDLPCFFFYFYLRTTFLPKILLQSKTNTSVAILKIENERNSVQIRLNMLCIMIIIEYIIINARFISLVADFSRAPHNPKYVKKKKNYYTYTVHIRYV